MISILCTNTMKRCEEYVISLLEQCEDLREVETFLQTRQDMYKDYIRYTNQARYIQIHKQTRQDI